MKMRLTVSAAALGMALAIPGVVTADEELAKKNNCLACHTVDKKILGPAFKDVAAKYKGDDAAAAMLVDKVRNGGSGTWGQVPMPPNPMLNEEDAVTLIDWVLSLE